MRYFLFLLIIFSCSDEIKKDKNISINIELKDSKNNEVSLEKINSNYCVELIKTDFIENDFLTLDVIVNEPSLYRLNIKGESSIDIILDENNINVNLNDNTYKINGSKGTDYLITIKEYIRDYQNKTYSLNRDFITANQNNDLEKIISIQNQSLELRNSFESNFKKILWDMANSIAVLFVSDYLKIENNYNFWDSIMVRYEKKLGYTSYYKDLNEKLKQIKVLSIGEIAPEIILNDLNLRKA